MADHRNATLTPSCTVLRATAAIVPTARTTPMAPTVRGAARISSAWGTRKPAHRATAVLSVSGRQCLLQTDGMKGKVSVPWTPRKITLGVRTR